MSGVCYELCYRFETFDEEFYLYKLLISKI